MKKWIEDLLALQELDIRLRNLGVRVKMLPQEMNDLKQMLADEKAAVQSAKEKIQRTELQIKQCESNIQVEKDEICRLGAQSNLVKKNDEYNAMLREIEGHKEKVSDLETEEIELWDAVEAAQEHHKQLEKDFSSREKGLKEDMQEIVDIANDLKLEIAKINEERPNREKSIDSEVLTKYKRLLSKGKGSPLSSVIDGNCGNCHLKVVPQVINAASKGDEATCNNCGFLLYTQE